MAEVLYAAVAQLADLRGTEHVLDLYCGTGTIALSLAHRAGRVTGIELVPEAVEDARRAAERAGVQNVAFYAGDAGTVLAELCAQRPDGTTASFADVAIVDPPRAGLLPAALSALTLAAPATLVYVSCNPAALARDLVSLAAVGFELVSIQPVDLFPQTAHIECVALLRRGA